MLEGDIHVQTVAAIAVATVGGFLAGNAPSLAIGAITTAPVALLAIKIAPTTETVAVTWLKESEGMDPSAAAKGDN